MSLLGKLASSVGKVVKKVASSPAVALIPGPVGGVLKAGAALGLVGGAAKVVTSSSKALVPVGKALTKPGVGKIAAGTVAGTVAGDYLYDAAGNIIGQKQRHRRMNPMNVKAARRAIRRVKAARKILRNIEKQLPKAACRKH